MKIPPNASRAQVLDALCDALDLIDPVDLSQPLREHLAGGASADRLHDSVAAHAQHGCTAAPRIGVLLTKIGTMLPAAAVEEINFLVASALTCQAFVLVALAALHQDDPRFAATAEQALKVIRAAVATKGGPVPVLDAIEKRAAQEPPPPGDDIGRNRPCGCGSGTKYKLCCGRAR